MSPRNRHTTATRLIAATFVAVVLVALTSSVAFADQISDAKAQAAKVQAQVDSLNTKAEQASEAYNAAASRYETLSGQAQKAARQLSKITAQKDKLQSELDDRAAVMYRQGPLSFINALISVRSFSDFDAVYQVLMNISRQDAKTVDTLKTMKAEATAAHDRLVAARNAAQQQKVAKANNAATVKASLSQAKGVLAQANQQVRTLIAAEAARQAAAARAEAARLASSGGGSSRNVDWGPAPPASEIGKRAVWFAEKKLGCAYVWAASGPNTFDCSGLTMWAYDQVGVSLPHYSRDQINCGRRVNRSDLAPGDLVFFGSPIHHVGMYVGNGDFIEAPYTGANVRIRPLDRGDYAGACRPYAK